MIFNISPDHMFLVVRQSMPEKDLQDLRENFPSHVIVAMCDSHIPHKTVMAAEISHLDNLPPCSIRLDPDDSPLTFD